MRVKPALTGVAALAAVAVTAGVVAVPSSAGAAAERVAARTAKRTVMVVGNNWDGTVSFVDAGTLRKLKTINVVPDKDEEILEANTPVPDPQRPVYYYAVQQVVAEGHDQYVDDVFTTRDGRYLAVSRPSLRDVVWIDIAKAAAAGPEGDVDSIVAEQSMDGYRTDHMGVSPDRRRLLVSDSTARQVIEFSMVDETLGDGTTVEMGERLRSFPSGDTPHENNYSHDGSRIFHASIGRVYTPFDYPGAGLTEEDIDGELVHDTVKADRWLQVVRNRDFDILKRWDMGLELEEAGHPEMSSAVRPVAITPDERIMYAQVSFFHGLVEFNMVRPDPTGGGDYALGGEAEPAVGKVTRLIDLPIADEVKEMRREDYVLDSAHHGLAINERGSKLCVAGTMSDYAAIVDRDTFTPKVLKGGGDFVKPYWATEGPGNTCWLSMSGTDMVTVISFARERIVAKIPVGDHPQRIREGQVLESIVAGF